MMARFIQQARERFEALQTRERQLIILVAVALVWAVAQLGYFNAAQQREKQLRAAMAETRTQLVTLGAQETILTAQLSEQGLATLQARLEELKRRRAALDEDLLRQGIKLLDPARMREVMHDLLHGSGLRLHALQRLPVEVAYSTQPPSTAEGAEQTTPKPDGPGVTLYRHALQLELDGSYPDMVRYLERLEASGWNLRWHALDIKTVDYPLARMRLTVYTLSLQKEWIGV